MGEQARGIREIRLWRGKMVPPSEQARGIRETRARGPGGGKRIAPGGYFSTYLPIKYHPFTDQSLDPSLYIREEGEEEACI
jgi:hypothetical protein